MVVLSYDFWKNQLGGAPDIVGPKGAGEPVPDDGCRRRCAGISWHRRGRGSIALDSSRHVGAGHSRLHHDARSSHALDADPGPAEAGRVSGASAGRAAALVQSDVGRGHASRRLPKSQRRAAAAVSCVDAGTHSRAARSFWSAATRFSQPLWVLFAATAVLLALACLNVAGLFLARGSAREREISTRLALGASRGRIGRQLLADSVLLALAGGLLGVAMAPLAVRALIAFLPQNTAANGLHANVDTRLLLFAFLVSLATGFLAGCAGFAGRPQIAGLLAPGAGRHSLRRPRAAQGDCDGSDRIYADSGRRGRFVCANALRAVGKRSGV